VPEIIVLKYDKALKLKEVLVSSFSTARQLGLVVNIIILWNTLYINAALDQLVGEGYSILPKDVARLSPLVFEHINLLGRYAFTVPDAVVRGQLRPLRNPADALADVA
jgi:hypothetical protein